MTDTDKQTELPLKSNTMRNDRRFKVDCIDADGEPHIWHRSSYPFCDLSRRGFSVMT